MGTGCLAFIANTDFGWFSHFLHRAEPPDEVDFWQPSPHGFKAVPSGAPFFFRLGAPHNAAPDLSNDQSYNAISFVETRRFR